LTPELPSRNLVNWCEIGLFDPLPGASPGNAVAAVIHELRSLLGWPEPKLREFLTQTNLGLARASDNIPAEGCLLLGMTISDFSVLTVNRLFCRFLASERVSSS
jgi:hypothetical protein